MRKPRFVGIPIVLFGIAWVGIMALITVGLWNVLMPPIFGVSALSFWQALGLLVLSRLLFGRFGRWGSGSPKARFVRGWKDLTPDELERFRRGMGSSFPGKFGEGESAEKG